MKISALTTLDNPTGLETIPALSGVETVAVRAGALAAAAVAPQLAIATTAAANAAAAAGFPQLNGNLPIGWIDLADNGITGYENDYGVTWFSNGLRCISMMPETYNIRAEWKGALRLRNPADGLTYIEVLVERIYDPTKQGIAAAVRYVHTDTGNDANNGLTPGTAWKTVNYAVTQINADGSSVVFDLLVDSTTFIAGNAQGWDTGNMLIGTPGNPKRLRIKNIGAGRPWLLPGMRGNYTMATFAWIPKGNGIWACSTGAISAAAKNSPFVADLSVLDADGAPTFSDALAGPFADEAAVLVPMQDRPSFYYLAATGTWYVKLASGAKPNPGVNFAYSELQAGNTFSLAEGSRLLVENFRCVFNCGAADQAIFFWAHPQTYTIGAAAPNVVHDIQVTWIDCESYGSSGNSFGSRSVTRTIIKRCKAKYGWLDGVNTHSLYVPGNSNAPEQGSAQHTWVEDFVAEHLGPNNFKGQPAVNTSCNAITDHDRGRTTAVNCRGGLTYGAVFAFTGGAKGLALNCNMYEPTNTTTGAGAAQGTTSCKSPYWADGASSTAPFDGTELWLVHCTGQVKNSGAMFYLNTAARIVAVEFRGKKSTLKVNMTTGGIVDGVGAPI
ncbi:hypothetical protein J2W22_003024 [Sphingomonas kyeonggiensis]|uniref:hypothetical protein n=1 Tax=Sphingomonas kyeonggiensis TaxID=1268553 RepID=UPI00278B850D|nr:hypothetical protein [Sphingomonas kyeonggiensis]MDQ0250960.1 hypothetical protein [Sphingomonas kyeonggiensis]